MRPYWYILWNNRRRFRPACCQILADPKCLLLSAKQRTPLFMQQSTRRAKVRIRLRRLKRVGDLRRAAPYPGLLLHRTGRHGTLVARARGAGEFNGRYILRTGHHRRLRHHWKADISATSNYRQYRAETSTRWSPPSCITVVIEWRDRRAWRSDPTQIHTSAFLRRPIIRVARNVNARCEPDGGRYNALQMALPARTDGSGAHQLSHYVVPGIGIPDPGG